MAKTTQARSKVSKLIAAEDKRIRAAMGQAIRDLKREAKLSNTKLVVAGKNAWAVPK